MTARCALLPMLSLLLLCALAGAGAATPDDEGLKSQSDPVTGLVKSGDPKAYRILFIGDSITMHGTSVAIKKKLKWDHTAGMAASAADTDYAHLLAAKVGGILPDRKVEIYFHTRGGSGSAAQRLAAMPEVLPVEPHLVVVQLGEHEKAAAGEETFRANYGKLLSAFDGQAQKPLMVCTGVWNPYGKGTRTAYADWPAALDRIMAEVCKEKSVPFAPVMSYALDPACSGSGETSGVQWHPNDAGHRGYAEAIFAAIAPALRR